MAEAHWEDVRGEELRFRNHTWELTGDVDLLGTGERLHARARQVDGVRHDEAALLFGVDEGADSLNPGDLGDVFARLEPEDDGYALLVKVADGTRTYRYGLSGMEYV